MNHINRDEVFNKHLGVRKMTRAEEVADKFVSEWIAFDGFGTDEMKKFTAQLISSLPEFHPGRELTGEDIRKLCDETHGMPPTYWEFIAAELNKIRAPKKDHPYSMAAHVQNLQTDKNNLADRCNILTSRIADLEKERDDLNTIFKKTQTALTETIDRNLNLAEEIVELKAAKLQPVGVTKEQLKLAIVSVAGACLFTDTTLEKIADALSPKWIKCSDRMPDMYQKVFWLQERDNLIENGYYAGHVHPATTHWMPRYVPEPPKDEESELVRHLEKSMVDWDAGSREEIIQIVKEFEKGEKK